MTNQISWAQANVPDGQQIFSDAANYVVGGIFGNGGGQQLSNAILYENLRRQFGPERVNVAGSPELNVTSAHKKKRKGKPKRKRLGLASLDVPGAGAAGIHARRASAGLVRTGLPGPTDAARSAAQHRVRRGTRRAGKAALAAGRLTRVADKSGFATFLSFVDRPTPRRPPPSGVGRSLPDAAQAEQGGALDARPSGLWLGPVRQPGGGRGGAGG